MWLHGPAGAGKSAIAQTMAEVWQGEQKLGGSFFFAKWRAGGGSAARLFPTIAYQLALSVPELWVHLGLAVESDPAIAERTLEEQAQALIRRPLELLGTEKQYVVIVDGLDECDSKPKQCRIIQILSRLVAIQGFPLKFLVCSRPEPHLREVFESTPSRSGFEFISLNSFDAGRDILHYLRVRFDDIRQRCAVSMPMPPIWPTLEDLTTLVDKASGQFIYAETVLKFLEDEYSHPVERLRLVLSISSTPKHASIFSDLDALYTFILSANPNTDLIVEILGAYFVIPSADNVHAQSDDAWHCVAFLDGILELPAGSVRRAVRGLHSLLFIPDSDYTRIRLYHKSLYDFLSNVTRSGRFFLSPRAQDLNLAKHCFSIVEESVQNTEAYLPVVFVAHFASHCTLNSLI
jgi:hypothetical protein